MSLRAGVPIRDYVNQPKPNGYRSLHSRAVGIASNPYPNPNS